MSWGVRKLTLNVKIICHVKIKKALSPFYHKIFLIENEYKTLWVSYIHFLSKIFFMIKWTSGFFYFNVANSKKLFSGN